jgi:hypothetical protein
LQNTKHEYVLDRLSSYMDGQLPDDEQARVEAHLSTCQRCRDDLRTLRWTHDLLQEVVPVPIPRSFVIREADVTRPKRATLGGRSLATLQWATALVAIMLVLVVTGDVWNSARFGFGGAQPAMSSAELQAALAPVTVSPETEVIVTIPVQSESLAQSAQTPAAPTGEAMRLQVAPADKAAVAIEEPMSEDVNEESESQTPSQSGGESAQLPTLVPQHDGESADSAPVAAQLPYESKRPATWFPLTQAGWRIAEIGLGALLVGLVIAVVWVRRRKRI